MIASSLENRCSSVEEQQHAAVLERRDVEKIRQQACAAAEVL